MNCLLLPASNIVESTAYIDDPKQVAHIHQVLKAKVGDRLKVGQLDGNIGSGVIDSMTADMVQLKEVVLSLTPPPKLEVTVILALPRPKVLRRLIIDMTAIGVRDIILINSYRTQKSYWQSPMIHRLDEFITEGLQQSVDTVAPIITLKKLFKPFVEDELPSLIEHSAIVAHPYSACSLTEYFRPLKEHDSHRATVSQKKNFPDIVFIGAEGGWIDYEIELLKANGCIAVHCGPRILRTEAAVNVILGQWLL